jgi:hypothetical protein
MLITEYLHILYALSGGNLQQMRLVGTNYQLHFYIYYLNSVTHQLF